MFPHTNLFFEKGFFGWHFQIFLTNNIISVWRYQSRMVLNWREAWVSFGQQIAMGREFEVVSATFWEVFLELWVGSVSGPEGNWKAWHSGGSNPQPVGGKCGTGGCRDAERRADWRKRLEMSGARDVCLLLCFLACLLACTVDGSMTPPHAPTPYALLPVLSLPVYLSPHIHLVQQRRAFKEHPLNKRCSKTPLFSRRHWLTIFIRS